MLPTRRLFPADPEFPPRLAALDPPLADLSVRGRCEPAIAVAIVGTRAPCEPARSFARDLAAACVAAGAVVVSGGARGIDAAAHEGALAAGGRTWAVLPTGSDYVYPEEHGPLFDAVVVGGGALIWPCAPSQPARRHLFFLRNRVLVALADAVVVVQASFPSGALNAAKHARDLGRRLWVVTPPAWATRGFEGSCALLDQGATPLTSPRALLADLRLAPSRAPRRPRAGRPKREASSSRDPSRWDATTRRLFEVTETTSIHVEELIVRSGLPAGAASTALLTLVLENVLVEGPDGFFRRAHA